MLLAIQLIQLHFVPQAYKSNLQPPCFPAERLFFCFLSLLLAKSAAFCGSTAKSQRRGRTERLEISTVHEHEMKTQNLIFRFPRSFTTSGNFRIINRI